MTAKERNAYNLNLLKSYLEVHPEKQEFISVFEAIANNPDCSLTLNIGKSLESGSFLVTLASVVDKPIIHFSSNIDTIPQILVSTRTKTIAAFTLNVISNVSISYEEALNFDWYMMFFNYYGNDWKLTATIPKG